MWVRFPGEKEDEADEADEGEAPSGGRRKGGRFSRGMPVTICRREDFQWLFAVRPPRSDVEDTSRLSHQAVAILSVVRERGALFFNELRVLSPQLLPIQICEGISELAAAGLLSGDSFQILRQGLNGHATGSGKRRPSKLRGARGWGSLAGTLPTATSTLPGRFSRYFWPLAIDPNSVSPGGRPSADAQKAREVVIEGWARQLLLRWGIVGYDLACREGLGPRWSELVVLFRRLEARGEVRGGRFVAGMSGEQYAYEHVAVQLRDFRDRYDDKLWTVISTSDPLNLTGLLGGTTRIAARGSASRFVLQGGKPVAMRGSDDIELLKTCSSDEEQLYRRALTLHARYRSRDPFLGAN